MDGYGLPVGEDASVVTGFLIVYFRLPRFINTLQHMLCESTCGPVKGLNSYNLIYVGERTAL